MPLTYKFEKARLPRGLSFPLKKRALDAALVDAGVAEVYAISCLRGDLKPGEMLDGRIVLRADFYGRSRRRLRAGGRASIEIRAVPSAERRAVEETLMSEVLPRMGRWLRRLELEPSDSTRGGDDQHFVALWRAGTLLIELT